MTSTVAALRVAIVGAGPSGFYAAEALQKVAPDIAIDIFDQLPTPFGLVRGGVAPDHPKIKSVTRVFDRIAARPSVRYIGNVTVGVDLQVAELQANYDAIILTIGAATDRQLGIPGEALTGSHAATDFVGWYNGHPDFHQRHFDLSHSDVAVVGFGNVAMDVTRILLTPPDQLATTDIADHAVAALRDSRITTVHLLARRGPAQAACTTPELRELGEIPGVQVVIDPAALVLDPASQQRLDEEDDRTARKNLEVMQGWTAAPDASATRRIVLHFNVSPVALHGEHSVTGMTLMANRLEADSHGQLRAVATGQTRELPVGLVFRSVGYRGVALPGVPFDEPRGVIPNSGGRVVESPQSHTVIHGLYVSGWIKRGPSGVIGTNKACASETVDHLLADVAAERLPTVAGSPDVVMDLLRSRGVRTTSWEDWQRLDAAEQALGQATGKPRAKFTTRAAMLEALDP